MSNTDDQIVPSGEPSAAPSVPQDYEELRQFRASVEQQILPYWDDIKPLIEDEDSRELFRSARRTREVLKREAEPVLPPEMELLEKRLESKFGGAVEWISAQQKREQETAAKAEQEKAAAAQAAIQVNVQYAQRIMAERPDDFGSPENPSRKFRHLVRLAADEGMSLEDAYKEFGPTYFGVKPQPVPSEERAARAPRSLRAGDPGVPGESTLPKPQTQKERLARMRQNMIAAGGGRG